MTLEKLINQIDFDNKSIQDDIDWERLAYCFNIYDFDWSTDTRMKSYFIKTWYCTDSYVGTRAYFLDGKFVAISNQSGRKSDEIFKFSTKETFYLTRDYILSLRDKEEEEFEINLLSSDDLNKEIDSMYKIEFNSQVRHRFGYLKGERVKIIKTNTPHTFYVVTIEKENGEKLTFQTCSWVKKYFLL